jgi:hypothetical protein
VGRALCSGPGCIGARPQSMKRRSVRSRGLMRKVIALSAVLIGSAALAADAIHLTCTGTQLQSGFNNNVSYPATVSLVVGPDFVEGSDGIGGQIVQADERRIVFMTNSYIAGTNDNWKTSTRRDVCIYGSIDRVTGKTGVTSTYGKCSGISGPPQGALEFASSYDLLCRVVNRLF